LSTFSLWREDAHIRPILDKALDVNRKRIKLMASPWSPPAWMKSGKNLFGGPGGYLRAECYDIYAEYFIKFIQAYESKGSPVYAITLQNEPQYAPNSYPGMLMSVENQIGLIRDYLGPKLINLDIKTKIIGFDHNYDSGGFKYASDLLLNAGANQYTSGIGWHTYTNPSHQNMARIHDIYNKDVWITEAGSGTWIGSSTNQFQDQMMHSIRSPRNWAKGVIFWNVALDQNAGPKLVNVDTTNTNRGLITIRSDIMDSISYETGYFSMGHSSRFVDPGSQRIDTNTFDDDVENVAYQNLDKTIVVVISNRTPTQRIIKIKWNFKSFQYNLPGLSAVTFKWDGSASDGSDNSGGGGEVLPSVQFVYIRSRANNKYLTVNTAGNLIASAT
jgi:glucosylceramidase